MHFAVLTHPSDRPQCYIHWTSATIHIPLTAPEPLGGATTHPIYDICITRRLASCAALHMCPWARLGPTLPLSVWRRMQGWWRRQQRWLWGYGQCGSRWRHQGAGKYHTHNRRKVTGHQGGGSVCSADSERQRRPKNMKAATLAMAAAMGGGDGW